MQDSRLKWKQISLISWMSVAKQEFKPRTWWYESLDSPHMLPKELNLKRKTQTKHLAQLWGSYLSQDITEITSLFGVRKTKQSGLAKRKPPATMSRQARSNLFLFFSRRLRRIILVFISQTSPFQKIILWNLLGKLTWLSLALGWPPHALQN